VNAPSTAIRAAVLTDADGLFLIALAFATSFTPERASFDATLRDVLGDTSARLLVADSEGQIVGYLLGFDHGAFYANGRVSWVEEVAVHSPYRGRGIGRLLMLEFETWAASRGSRLVGLATRRAATFYRDLGYEESAAYFRKVI
jgi:GNAT superfamily N-acetyltransferase